MSKKSITAQQAEQRIQFIYDHLIHGEKQKAIVLFEQLNACSFPRTQTFNLKMGDVFMLLGSENGAIKNYKSVITSPKSRQAQKKEASEKLDQLFAEIECRKEKNRRQKEEKMWLDFIEVCKQKGEDLYKEVLGEGNLTKLEAQKIVENLTLAYDFTGSMDAAHMLLRILQKQGMDVKNKEAKFIKIKTYEGDLPYIFISYAHKDNDIVLPVVQSLQQEGFRIWLDQGIEVGTEWPTYIANHLNDASCVLVFMSENAENSKNCRNEINLAEHLGKDIVVIHMDEYEMNLGMQLQIGSRHALYRTRHITYESFINALCNAKILANCKE